MSNALIFYKQQDPSSSQQKDTLVLSDKEKRAYDSFFKPLSISQFKDNVKRSRSTFTDPTDKNALPGWTKNFIIDYVLFPLVSESIIGEVKEVKGMVNETLKIFFNFKESDGTAIAQAKIIQSIQKVLSNAFASFNSKKTTENNNNKQLDGVDQLTSILNSGIDLIDCIGAIKDDLKELFDLIENQWIPYQQQVLGELVEKVIGDQQYLTKHVDMIGDLLRNVSSTLNRLESLIPETFITFLLEQIDRLLTNCMRLKKETVSHASALYFAISINRKKRSIDEVLSECMGLSDSNAERSLEKLSKLRAAFSVGGSALPFHKYNVMEYLVQFLDHTHPVLKLYAMSVMVLALQTITTSQFKEQFSVNVTLQNQIYEAVGRSLDFPAKKVSYWIDTIVNLVIANSEFPKKYAESCAIAALALNPASRKRKYYLLGILHDFLPAEFIINNDKQLISELMVACGEYYVLPAPGLLYKILNSLYLDVCNKDIQQWRKYWEEDYFRSMVNQGIQVVRGMIIAVNSILARINKDAIVYMLGSILNEKEQQLSKQSENTQEASALASRLSGKNGLWIFVSFLRVAKEKCLVIDGADGSFTLQGLQNVTISTDRLAKLILNKDRNVIANILEFISINPKPSEPPSDIDFNLLLLTMKLGTRTSFPEYRRDLLSSFKRFIERLRLVYERDLQLLDEGKQPKKKNFQGMVRFIQQCVDVIFSSMYPQMSFEIANPMLEILLLILTNFPTDKPYEYKKGLFVQPSKFLKTQIVNPPIFSQGNIECLLVNSNSQWESVRQSSLSALQLFPVDSMPLQYLQVLNNECNTLIRSAQIKNYEAAAGIVLLQFKQYLPVLSLNEVSFLKNQVNSLKSCYQAFEKSFLVDWQIFSDNLVHGQITALALILQHISPQILKDNQSELKTILADLFSVLCDVLAFATKISSENVTTVVLDSGQQVKKAVLDEEKQKQIASVDCRGHIIFDEESKAKNHFLQNMEKILSGTSLIETLEDNGGDGEGGANSENVLVVAFYLISREAGFLFQSIAELALMSQRESIEVFDKGALSEIVNQYFHALVNIKHLGSIDRIAIGLSTMCKAMNEAKNPLLPHLSENLLSKLLEHIEANSFKNTMRRSAGLPSAIVCLLKAECSGRRAVSVEQAVQKLLKLSESSPHTQVKIHCLNILKKIFEDSSLKIEVDKFISIGFQTAIKGFAIEDWSIRNSSLMLFSALSLRTVGGCKNPNAQTLKSKLNLLEFFARAPELLEFFKEQISQFVNTDMYTHNQYPPLYPIALLFTRLLPYDLKNSMNKAGIGNGSADQQGKSSENNNSDGIDEVDTLEEQMISKPDAQYIPLEEVQKILPLLIQCANNKNYMGRVMVARSILPFMVFEQIPAESVNLLERIESYEKARKSHNFTHGILLQILNVLKNYYDMKREMGLDVSEQENPTAYQVNNQHERNLAEKLAAKIYLLTKIKCPPVQHAYLDLVRELLANLRGETLTYALDLLKEVDEYAKVALEGYMKASTLRLQDDMGHSVLRKKLLRYILQKGVKTGKEENINTHLGYLETVLMKYRSNPELYTEEDNEFLRIILKEVLNGLKRGENIFKEEDKLKALSVQLISVLKDPKSEQWLFSQCLVQIIRIIFTLGIRDIQQRNKTKIATSQSSDSQLLSLEQLRDCSDIIKRVHLKFSSNGQLMKQVVRLSGLLMRKECLDIEYFEKLSSVYSKSDQMDYLRVGVIEAFKLCLPNIFKVLLQQDSSANESSASTNYSLFLKFSYTFVRLLQDEVPEVRQKMSNFLTKTLLHQSGSIHEEAMIYEVTLKQFFEFIASQKLHSVEDEKLRAKYLLQHIFEMEFFNVKKTNHLENRIFAYDKSNKFIDEMRIKKYAFKAFVDAKPKFTAQELKEFVESKNYSFVALTQERREEYVRHFSARDEYEFENMLHENLYKKLLHFLDPANYPLSDKEDAATNTDPFIKYFDQV